MIKQVETVKPTYDNVRGWLGSEWIPGGKTSSTWPLKVGWVGRRSGEQGCERKAFLIGSSSLRRLQDLCKQECWSLWWRSLDLEMPFAVCSCTARNSHPLTRVLNLLILCFNSSQRGMFICFCEKLWMPLREHVKIIWIAVGEWTLFRFAPALLFWPKSTAIQL